MFVSLFDVLLQTVIDLFAPMSDASILNFIQASSDTLQNYLTMFVHKRLWTNLDNLAIILLNIDAVTILACSRDNPM